MRFFKKILPHGAMVLSAALVVLCILDARNPRMGFLYGWSFTSLVIANFLFVLGNGLLSCFSREKAEKCIEK